jgi:hypothetical protein
MSSNHPSLKEMNVKLLKEVDEVSGVCADVSVGALGGPHKSSRGPTGPRIRACGALRGPHATRSGPRAEAQRSHLGLWVAEAGCAPRTRQE